MNNPQNARRARPSRNNGKQRSKRTSNAARIDQKVRGNPKQLLEKYKNLARDALQAGERIDAENYLQHADHYQRVLNERNGLSTGLFDDEDDDFQDDAGPRRPSRRNRREAHEAAEAGRNGSDRAQGQTSGETSGGDSADNSGEEGRRNQAVDPGQTEQPDIDANDATADGNGGDGDERPRRRSRRVVRQRRDDDDDQPSLELKGEEAAA